MAASSATDANVWKGWSDWAEQTFDCPLEYYAAHCAWHHTMAPQRKCAACRPRPRACRHASPSLLSGSRLRRIAAIAQPCLPAPAAKVGDRVRYTTQLSSMLKAAVGRRIGSKQASPFLFLVVSATVRLLAAGPPPLGGCT